MKSRERTPVLILGGGANALSIARALGRHGVKVHALNDSDQPVRYSRYCSWIRVPHRNGNERDWEDYLLSPEAEKFSGAILLAACDAGLILLSTRREELSRRYRLDISDPRIQLALLDKLQTYKLAVLAGVSTPRFWEVNSAEEIRKLRSELVFPLIIKPRISHLYQEKFVRKFVVAEDEPELFKAFSCLKDRGIQALLVELIPGGDEQLCSYYTYLDDRGENHFDFTKRVIRRYPTGMGGGSYHITDRNPKVRTEALRLLRSVGLQGVANVEFKRDPRDGVLKLIECNARFTAANNLLEASGFPLSCFIYERITGQELRSGHPIHFPKSYRDGLRLWDPLRDFHAYRELRAQRKISFLAWIRSLRIPDCLPYFSWTDPLPSLVHLLNEVKTTRWVRFG